MPKRDSEPTTGKKIGSPQAGRFSHLGRREFLATAAAGGTGLALKPSLELQAAERSKGGRMRVVLVGTGIRGIGLWGKTLQKNYSDVVEFVGLCDINRKRMAFAREYIGLDCPLFTDFDEMIQKTSPDRVMITTTDCFHAKYICRAMELGLDVISEKPMATDEMMIQDIMNAIKRTGRKLIITHNYRYGPDAELIKKLLDSEEIGTITSVDFNYYLDTDHGTSYFRRWHGFKQFNGSLLVAKSCHHFDLAQWWLGAEPAEVHAFGALRRFGFNGEFRNARCMSCPHKSKCEWYFDITKDPLLMDLYVKAESEDGYLRDACVYRRDINIWDTMSLNVRYHSGVMMSYSLNCFMPYEGYKISFNGTHGRLDARVYHAQPWKVDVLAEIRITPLFKASRTETVGAGTGGHWGSDTKMQDMIFRGPRPDPLHQAATPREAALACLVGIAARRSIEQQRPIFIEELVQI
jgi:predicted dehydrogenase